MPNGSRVRRSGPRNSPCARKRQGNTLLNAALDYAERGVRVFPVRARGKVPLIERWPEKATTDAEIICAWWGKWPDANIGMPTGQGRIVLDVDGAEGDASLKDLEAKHGSLPSTAVASTGKGIHLHFTTETKIGNSAGKLGEGLDIRGDGGYVVLPPSVHPSGERYGWFVEGEPAPAPEWLVTMLIKPSHPTSERSVAELLGELGTLPADAYRRAALEGEVGKVLDAPEGTRNNTLNEAAFRVGQLYPEGAPDEVREALEAAGIEAGLDPREVQATVASGLSAGALNPRSVATDNATPTHNATQNGASDQGGSVGSVGSVYQKGEGECAQAPSFPLDQTGALLDELATSLERYVAFPSEAARDVAALWALHTWVIEAFDVTPYLAITSPEKRSGKTRVLDVLEHITKHPWRPASLTEAVIYRKIELDAPTVLFDEVDTIFSRGRDYEGLRGILNAGYRRGQKVSRIVGEGTSMVPKDFEVFAAKAFAGIGDLPDTIADRSIHVRMARKPPGVSVAQFRYAAVKSETEGLRERLSAWGCAAREALASAEPDVPMIGNDRVMEVWEPLLAIADLAGEPWASRARQAMVSLYSAEVAESEGTMLLRHIREAFGDKGRMHTEDLLEALVERDDGPWAVQWGYDVRNGEMRRPASKLAKRLDAYGIKPRQIKIDGENKRGYVRADFEDAWRRYLPTPAEDATNATNATLQVSVGEMGSVLGQGSVSERYSDHPEGSRRRAQAGDALDLPAPRLFELESQNGLIGVCVQCGQCGQLPEGDLLGKCPNPSCGKPHSLVAPGIWTRHAPDRSLPECARVA